MEDIKLKRLVEKIVREELQMLFEYSHTRKDLIFRVESLLSPLLSHWVLIRYNRLTSNEEYIQHWKGELKSWFISLMRLRLKDNNGFKYREKAIQSAYDNLDLTSDIKVLYLTILPKCEKEKINTKDKLFKQAMIDCVNDLETIKLIIANSSVEECENYIDNL